MSTGPFHLQAIRVEGDRAYVVTLIDAEGATTDYTFEVNGEEIPVVSGSLEFARLFDFYGDTRTFYQAIYAFHQGIQVDLTQRDDRAGKADAE